MSSEGRRPEPLLYCAKCKEFNGAGPYAFIEAEDGWANCSRCGLSWR